MIALIYRDSNYEKQLFIANDKSRDYRHSLLACVLSRIPVSRNDEIDTENVARVIPAIRDLRAREISHFHIAGIRNSGAFNDHYPRAQLNINTSIIREWSDDSG